MKSFDLNKFPSLLENHQLTQEQGIKLIAEFISTNYPVFGLQLFNEDFRSEVMVVFLEKGTSIFSNYKPELGDFFTFLYGYISNIISSLRKKNARNSLQENLTEIEIKKDYAYSPYMILPSQKPAYYINEAPVPYKSSKINPKELKNGYFVPEDTRIEKTLLTLALKSAYYITDNQIRKISMLINMNEDELRNMIEYFRKELDKKHIKRQKMEEYRNRAYYCHRKYEKQIHLLTKEIELEHNSTQNYFYKSKIDKLQHIDNKQKSNWERLNFKFQNGFNIKPSNLAIANMLGICERQVSYYLFCARTGKTDLSELNQLIEELDKD